MEESRAHGVAAVVEHALGMKGSSVQPQTGRWGGDIESGYVVECVTDGTGFPREALLDLRPKLQVLVRSGLTFYVTAEVVECMEVF